MTTENLKPGDKVLVAATYVRTTESGNVLIAHNDPEFWYAVPHTNIITGPVYRVPGLVWTLAVSGSDMYVARSADGLFRYCAQPHMCGWNGVEVFCTGIDEAKSLCEQHNQERVARELELVV